MSVSYDVEVLLCDAGPWDPRARARLSPRERGELCQRASGEFRDKVTRLLMPRLRQFEADLVLVSAGFDAHCDDLYHFLTEDDYNWVTGEVVGAAQSCGGAVVSVLEGGYSLEPASVPKKIHKNSPNLLDPAGTANQSDNRFALLPGDGGLVKG
jgi:Histone deacetylase domain